MDDYSVSSLADSKNEWCARLLNILTPSIIVEINNIFKEAYRECQENDEEDKYLMTFQVCLSSIPKWNKNTVEEARKKITEKCKYLEELITCVHLIQLKSLTCVRVCQKQKKVDIDIPSVDDFIHKVFSNVARRLYTNIYLFEKGIPPLQIQKHNRELELIIKECILNTVRETMPVEAILRAYMDETEDNSVDVKEEIVMENMPPEMEAKLLKAENDKMKKENEIKVKPVAAAVPTIISVPPTTGGAQAASLGATSLGAPSFGATSFVKDNKSVGFSKTNEALDSNGNRNIVLDDSDSGIIKIGGDIKLESDIISNLDSNPVEIQIDTLPF
jgi:hypothetical protein